MKSKHDDQLTLEYNHIVDGIYVGTNMCCQTHFDEELKEKGIKADVSLEGERVDSPFGVSTYLWLPVKDGTAPTIEQLETGVSFLEKLVSLGIKIYLHCKHGHGRAPTLMIAYLIKKGNSLSDAEQIVKEKRSAIHLEESQREILRVFAQTITTAAPNITSGT